MLACNLIDRVPDPRKFLDAMGQRINKVRGPRPATLHSRLRSPRSACSHVTGRATRNSLALHVAGRVHAQGELRARVHHAPIAQPRPLRVQDKWLGGYEDKDGKPVYTADGLFAALNQVRCLTAPPVRGRLTCCRPQNFVLLESEKRTVPFVIRETKRKFQHSQSEMSVWQRR